MVVSTATISVANFSELANLHRNFSSAGTLAARDRRIINGTKSHGVTSEVENLTVQLTPALDRFKTMLFNLAVKPRELFIHNARPASKHLYPQAGRGSRSQHDDTIHMRVINPCGKLV